MTNQQPESCSICWGDGRIANAFGSHTTCPSCHGSGRRQETTGFRDVTKTKPSHFEPSNKRGAAAPKQTWPATKSGQVLANDVQKSAVSDEVKARLVREIIAHEDTHGQCTQTFAKKLRKEIR